jgi:hypothetical protein
MFERISNGWELAKQSWHVLKLDKQLLLFPLFSGVACLLVFASFALPLWNSEMLHVVLEDGQAPENPLAYVLLFVFYFVNYFVIVFFNAALIGCAIIRFNGGSPTIGDGFGVAVARLPQILGWALVSATVGWILKIIESRSERAGQFVAGLLGMGWSAVTYFVVPIVVVEKVGPIDAVKRSFAVLRKTWGEALTANFGIGLFVFLLSLVAFVPIIGGVVALAGGQTILGAAAIATGVVLLLIISLISSALNTIVIAALYQFAAHGTVPEQFDEAVLQSAFSTHR